MMTGEKTLLKVLLMTGNYSNIEVTGTDMADVISKAKILHEEFAGFDKKEKPESVSSKPGMTGVISDLNPRKEGNKKPSVVRLVCPECGEKMVKRYGARGEFWGCSGYPGCHGTRNAVDKK